MNLRQIIVKALKRLNISQPNPSQFDKGIDAVERWWSAFSSNPCINSYMNTLEVNQAGSNIVEINNSDISAIIGIHGSNGNLSQVDLLTWYDNCDNENYFAITQIGKDKFKLYHKDNGKPITIIYRKYVTFGIDTDLDIGEDIIPLVELYICRELARTAEQYQRYATEYASLENSIVGNRANFVLPTRETDCYWGR